MLALHQFWALLRKDILIDLRRRENLVAMFLFALLTLVTLSFGAVGLQEPRYRLSLGTLDQLAEQGWSADSLAALRPLLGRAFSTQTAFLEALGSAPIEGEARARLVTAARGETIQDFAPGFLWVTFLLAGVLGLDKSFGQERENHCMDGLLLSPAGRGVIYLGKMAGNALFLTVVLVLLAPLYALLFRLDLGGAWAPLALVAGGAVLGFSALGTLLGGVVTSVRGKEVLLPLLLFPLMAPLLIAAVQLTQGVFDGRPLSELADWLRLMGAFDAVYLIVALLTFEFVVEG